ncbi:Aldo/keto reductase [Xylaria bambusicola]|uniref:Aldo/keto reductase n=1 Tax=Xylaria bambusicola TaxID=326684 RepID=UPI002007C3D0|nr:Aldo/keto reductase [Xylaria bambusicola]KAI0528215.1 Aldo/keto reductase [Xylaria bambusicola]
MSLPPIERTTIGDGISIPRMISGLWQLVDDKNVDLDAAAHAMKLLADLGLDCFDMADHYGDAELVVGRFRATSSQHMLAFTKWCPPENGIKSFEAAEQAVDLALRRMGQEQITLMQYHIWDYSDDTYWHNLAHLRTMQQQGKIKHIGVTNIDAAHLELLIDTGFEITTNQVPCSVLDQRLVRGRLASVCEKHKVGVLAYGTLLGGFLSEKWLGQPEPEDIDALNGSLRKYLRFIRVAGGWEPFQGLLRALSTIAHAHNVSIPAVATRYVLDIPTVSTVIVGCRLTSDSSRYAERNLEVFSFRLTEDDHALIQKAQQALLDIPGDCGDEYRRPPYLTAAGDLSHHINIVQNDELREAIATGRRIEYSIGSPWEPIAGYCRAVRTGNHVCISGTTANSPSSLSLPVLGRHSARSQTVAILDIISRALKALGGTLSDVVRTRIIVRNEADCKEVSQAHGWVFQCEGVRPSNTLFVASLIGSEYLVEIEAEARLGSAGVLRLSS